MTRPPHVRRVYLPPEEPPRESLASLLLGLLALMAIAVVLLWLLPLLASPEAPW